jgi:hypothetical protein
MAYLNYVKGDHPTAEKYLEQSFDLDRDYPEARWYDGLLNFHNHFLKEAAAEKPSYLESQRFPMEFG